MTRKQRRIIERNNRKRNKKQYQNNVSNEIKSRGDEKWKMEKEELYLNLNFYHLTTLSNRDKIERSGYLKGNSKTTKLNGLSERGFFYSTIGFNKSVWDSILFHQIFESRTDIENSLFQIPKERDYVVYKINGSSFLKRGIKLSIDNNDGINNTGSVKCYLGNDVIPLSEVERIGEFKTFNDEYGGRLINESGYFIDEDGNELEEPNWIDDGVDSKKSLNRKNIVGVIK